MNRKRPIFLVSHPSIQKSTHQDLGRAYTDGSSTRFLRCLSGFRSDDFVLLSQRNCGIIIIRMSSTICGLKEKQHLFAHVPLISLTISDITRPKRIISDDSTGLQFIGLTQIVNHFHHISLG